MASSSTSSVPKSFKYDVFLSFRGEDTRTNFIDHLYSALELQSVYTYKDDERIKKGKRIDDELMRSIEESRFYIVVFSKNYASSSWCLDELVKIVECHKQTGHTAYPVFYDVEPSEVRKQTGAVGEAFAKLKKEKAIDSDQKGVFGKVISKLKKEKAIESDKKGTLETWREPKKGNLETWREALKEAADLAGWELKKTDDGHEAKFIKRIVEEVSLQLRSVNFLTDEKLVGMETRKNNLLSLLRNASNDVHMIGIWGIGGGGKTTLARAIFNDICYEFEGKSFIENVREVSTPSFSGLKLLQKQILSDILNNQGINVGSENQGKNMMSQMIRGRKVLLVLDDVDHINQLEALAGDRSWFKAGSIIIITTRENQVLVAHGVKIHNVNLLTDEEAIFLFTRYAFGRGIPKGYEELSRQVVRYAAGLPLTIKVLGSSLCGKSKPEWVDGLARLKKIPEEEIQKKLELSYISLDNEQKEMFLDVATVLKGWPKDRAIEALESCGFYAVIGLRVLEQKSLITFYRGRYNKKCVGMHDQLEEMGRNIVRRDMPNKRSRLWDNEEIEDILATDQGTEATRCIKFEYDGKNPKIIMKGLRKMKELRFLHVNMEFGYFNREIDKLIPNFPDALRYLCWKGYPFWSLPKGFQANNLVALEIKSKDIVQLWEGGERKVLNKLKFLYLDCCKLRFIDLGMTPNLDILKIETDRGYGLEVYMPIKYPKLRILYLSNIKLRSLDIGLIPNLEELRLSHCKDLQELHMGNGCVNLTYIRIWISKLRTLDIGPSPNLETLELHKCWDLEEIHIATCPILTEINIEYSKLRTLDLRLAPNLSSLRLKECEGSELHLPTKCLSLMSLCIIESNLRTFDLGLTPNLKNLYLEGCNNLVEIHTPIGCLKNLAKSDLSGSLVFKYFSFSFAAYSYHSSGKLNFTLKICPLHPDKHLPEFRFTIKHIDDGPPLRRSIEKLISEGPCVCTKLEMLLRSISMLQLKGKLQLIDNIPDQPQTQRHYYY